MKLLFIIIIIILLFSFKPKKQNRNSTSATTMLPSEDPQQEIQKKDFSQAYREKYLFTLNEKNEFRKLLTWASNNNYYVFPKVRLLDIIEPRKNSDNYKSLLWKIQAKHVDFVICDREFKIQFIIELDDNSHSRSDRVERDEFLSQALSGAGYTVNHANGISEEFLNNLKH